MVDGLDLDETYGIVLAGEGWHPGVIGIVASRLVEEMGRPTILVALDGDEGAAPAGRSRAFDLHAGLAACAATCSCAIGGHRAAAGVTVARDRVTEFAARFNAVARARARRRRTSSRSCASISSCRSTTSRPSWRRCLRHFEPFGVGNPAPALLARGVPLAGPPRPSRRTASSCACTRARATLDAVALGGGPSDRGAGGRPAGRRGLPASSATSGTARAACRPRSADFRCEDGAGRVACASWPGGGAAARIAAPAGDRVRPTADRVREAWMSIVHRRGCRRPACWICSPGRGRSDSRRCRAAPRDADFVEQAPAALRASGNTRRRSAPVTARRVHRADALRVRRRPRRARVRRRLCRPPVWPGAGGRAGRSAGRGAVRDLLGIEHRNERGPAGRRGPAGVWRHGDHDLPTPIDGGRRRRRRAIIRSGAQRPDDSVMPSGAMTRIAIYAGSFDPITRGHEDLMRRSLGFVDRLVVAVATNSPSSRCSPWRNGST